MNALAQEVDDMSILMRKSRIVAMAVLLGAGVAIAGCAQKANGPAGADLAGNTTNGLSSTPATPGSRRDFAQNVGDLVYFTTDSSDLTPEAQQTLRGQAVWLNQYPKYTITVEGHADERGTREYNIALGARRATSVKNFLAANGVDARRMRTISFGKERPVAVCDDISCWSQNRRAQTVLNNRVAGG
jgi:peptidoglycan-associated lipoprotein